MRQGTGYTIAGLALSLGLMCASGNATGIEVEQLETQKFPSPMDDIERVNLPYFDTANRVQWEGTNIPSPNYKVCPKPAVLRAVLAEDETSEHATKSAIRKPEFLAKTPGVELVLV